MHTQGKLSGLAPDVTAVIAAYNVEKLLPNAVRSLTSQTLRSIEIIIVDDCSTDGTRDVSQALMADDERIRYVRLERNSGGVGGPRNRGIEEAMAPYVVFLDADDVLERHAAKNMLLAAEREQADVVAGRTKRLNMATGRTTGWYWHLYSESRVLSSIEDFPELIHDTTATNKLYSREFLRNNSLSFEEGLNYEDVLFTAELYGAFSKMVVLPEIVYEWRSYPTDVRSTITNQRYDTSNIRDRVSVLRRIRNIYAPFGAEIEREFTKKLLRHHARLYLNDVLGMSEIEAGVVLDEFRPLLSSLTTEDFDFLLPYERLIYASALAGDICGVRSAVLAERDGLTTGRFETSPEGALFWSANAGSDSRSSSADDDLSASLRTVLDHRLVKRQHALTKYHNQAVRIEVSRSHMEIWGRTLDSFGELKQALASGTISMRALNGREFDKSPLKWKFDGDYLTWYGRVKVPRRCALRERQRRAVQICLTIKAGETSSSTLVLPVDGLEPIVDRSLVGRILGDRWRTPDVAYPPAEFGVRHGDRGDIIVRSGRRAARPAYKRVRQLQIRLKARLRRIKKFASPRGPVGTTAYSAMRLLPVQSQTVVFESHMGRSRSDSPSAICRELKERQPEMRVIWVSGDEADQLFDPSERTVRRDSWGYLNVLARSRYLVDNQSFPGFFRKRAGQRYLQTWHGIPLKKMGLDEPLRGSSDAGSQFLAASAQWDGLVVPNVYFEETFVPAFAFKGEKVKYGTPRCDAIVNGLHEPSEIKARLGLDSNSKIILYAPTFREHRRNKAKPASLGFDLMEWRASFPDALLLLRAHYLNRFVIPGRASGFCFDCSSVDDVNELYAIADLLITDYSSVMFDFAVTGRPIVIYAPDWREYQEARGTYFDLKEQGPGTFAESQEELFEAVRWCLSQGPPPEQELFRRTFSGLEDGRASARAVDFLLGGWS